MKSSHYNSISNISNDPNEPNLSFNAIQIDDNEILLDRAMLLLLFSLL